MRAFTNHAFGLLPCIALPTVAHSQASLEHIPQFNDAAHADSLSMPFSPMPEERQDSVNYRITGKVRSVTDGDSLVLTGRRNARFVIRLSDMDAPETPIRNSRRAIANARR